MRSNFKIITFYYSDFIFAVISIVYNNMVLIKKEKTPLGTHNQKKLNCTLNLQNCNQGCFINTDKSNAFRSVVHQAPALSLMKHFEAHVKRVIMVLTKSKV